MSGVSQLLAKELRTTARPRSQPRSPASSVASWEKACPANRSLVKQVAVNALASHAVLLQLLQKAGRVLRRLRNCARGVGNHGAGPQSH